MLHCFVFSKHGSNLGNFAQAAAHNVKRAKLITLKHLIAEPTHLLHHAADKVSSNECVCLYSMYVHVYS